VGGGGGGVRAKEQKKAFNSQVTLRQKEGKRAGDLDRGEECVGGR
jgi:hypothetical protein